MSLAGKPAVVKKAGVIQPWVFSPVKDFEVVLEGQLSRYVVGLEYTVKPENVRLREQASRWLQDGLVRKVERKTPIARVEGVVKVLSSDQE